MGEDGREPSLLAGLNVQPGDNRADTLVWVVGVAHGEVILSSDRHDAVVGRQTSYKRSIFARCSRGGQLAGVDQLPPTLLAVGERQCRQRRSSADICAVAADRERPHVVRGPYIASAPFDLADLVLVVGNRIRCRHLRRGLNLCLTAISAQVQLAYRR